MRILMFASLAFLAAGPAVRFENDGVRVGAALVRGDVLELRDDGAAAFLVSGSALEAVSAETRVLIADGHPLILEPGLRVARVDGGFRFSTHGDREIRFAAGGEVVTAQSPVLVAATGEGWAIGGQSVDGLELRAGLQQSQDDVDSNLKRMQDETSRLKVGGVPKLHLRILRRYLGGDPLKDLEAASSVTSRIIRRVSPSGAP